MVCDCERKNDIELTLFDELLSLVGCGGSVDGVRTSLSASLLVDTHDVSCISAIDVSGISIRNRSSVDGEHFRWFMVKMW